MPDDGSMGRGIQNRSISGASCCTKNTNLFFGSLIIQAASWEQPQGKSAAGAAGRQPVLSASGYKSKRPLGPHRGLFLLAHPFPTLAVPLGKPQCSGHPTLLGH